MRVSALPRLLAALFAFVLVVAACGDDTDTDVSDTPTSEPAPAGSTTDDPVADPASPTTDAESAPTSEAPAEPEAAVPTVDLDVVADPAAGVNVHVTTTDFTVSPEAVGGEPVAGQGHYQLVVDGSPVLRFYNDWIHFGGVTEGDVEIGVQLLGNDGQPHTADGEPISHSVMFTVPPHEHGDHSHGEPEPLEFAGAAPSLSIEVVEDPLSGWNAFVTADGLTFSPEHASGDHVDGEGHLHIYANGQKLGRLYGPVTHIPALPSGEVEISVSANNNEHRPYVAGAEPIEAATTVVVP